MLLHRFSNLFFFNRLPLSKMAFAAALISFLLFLTQGGGGGVGGFGMGY